MNGVRGLNAAAGFNVPGSMVDNTFVLDSFVAAANNTGRRPGNHNNNNNTRLFSSPVSTTRDIGPNVHNGRRGGRIIDDTILLFDNNSYSIVNNTMGGHNNAMFNIPFYHSPQHDFINVDEIATTEFSSDNDPESTCSICLCELSTDSMAVQMRRCCHVFHRVCIQKWISVKKTCPLCRINL